MTIERFAAIGGEGDAQRAGHVAIGVGVNRWKVVVLDALAPEQADGFLERFAFDADMAALFGEVAGQDHTQVFDGQRTELGFGER